MSHSTQHQGSKSSHAVQSKSESHPRIEDDLPDAVKEKYSGKYLGKTLRHNTEGDVESKLGDHEMLILKLPVPPIETEAQAKAMVLRLFPVFDKLFFINLVAPNLKGPIEIHDDTNMAQTCYNGNGIILLNMSIPDRTVPLGEKLLCVLLHEMLHVFLDTYTCKCRSCERRTARIGGKGVTGHGATWCNAMFFLQEALARQVLWKVDCDLTNSVIAEMGASGWGPTEHQLKRWGLEGVIPKPPARVKRMHEHGKFSGGWADSDQQRLREPARGWTRKKQPKPECCLVM